MKYKKLSLFTLKREEAGLKMYLIWILHNIS